MAIRADNVKQIGTSVGRRLVWMAERVSMALLLTTVLAPKDLTVRSKVPLKIEFSNNSVNGSRFYPFFSPLFYLKRRKLRGKFGWMFVESVSKWRHLWW
jgi:hypothetical protein